MPETPPGWPIRSLAEVRAQLTGPGQPFEMEVVEIDGLPTRVWKHTPPNLGAVIARSRRHGEREFLIYQDERITYDAHFRAVAHLAHALVTAGVAPGDRIAFAMRNLPEWPVIFFAVTAIGAIAVPLNAWWSADELAYGIADSGARMLFLDGERHERLGRSELPTYVVRATRTLQGDARAFDTLLPDSAEWAGLPERELPEIDCLPDDMATIFYTSGTTGQPKGAVGTHRNMLTNILSTSYCVAMATMRRGEASPTGARPRTALLAIPLFHVTACSASMMGLIATGGTMVMMRRWDAGEALRLIERERIQAAGGVPTIAWQLLNHPDRDRFDLSSLELIRYGGAPAAPELVRRIAALPATPAFGWGMTETMATVTLHQGADYLTRPDSCGPAVPVADLKIMALDGSRELPVGQAGELWARGPMVSRRYWNAPGATAATFVDGWVRTGDLARLDEEGFCTIVDRIKDVVIRGGENIHSIEVENVLHAHPAVADAALVGVPHPDLGEEPVAVVSLRPGMAVDEAGLRDWVAARLAAFKVPVAIHFADAPLPRNATGKLMKRELRALFDAAG